MSDFLTRFLSQQLGGTRPLPQGRYGNAHRHFGRASGRLERHTHAAECLNLKFSADLRDLPVASLHAYKLSWDAELIVSPRSAILSIKTEWVVSLQKH